MHISTQIKSFDYHGSKYSYLPWLLPKLPEAKHFIDVFEKTQKWVRAIERLPQVVDRFRTVQIENRNFRFIMAKYDRGGVLFYCDPPYDKEFRSATSYEFDFKNQDFFDLHYYAKNAKAKVAISGYKSRLMQEVFKDFNFHEGPHRKNNRSSKEVYEGLWTNY